MDNGGQAMTAAALSSAVLEAKAFYDANQRLAARFIAVRRISNTRALPPHKRRLLDVDEAEAYVKAIGAEKAFKAVYEKLTVGQRRKLAEMVKGEYEAKAV